MFVHEHIIYMYISPRCFSCTYIHIMCMYTCVYIHIYVCSQRSAQQESCAALSLCLSLHIYIVYLYTDVYIHTCNIYICMKMCMHILYIYIYIYIYNINIHTSSLLLPEVSTAGERCSSLNDRRPIPLVCI